MYIFGIFCPKTDLVYKSLCKTYGISLSLSKLLCSKLGLTTKSSVQLLEGKHLNFITYFLLGKHPIGNDIVVQNSTTFRRYKHLKLLKYIQISKGLPINGQQTRTNAKNSKKLNSQFIKLTY